MRKPTQPSFPGASLVACEIAQQPALWPTTLEICKAFKRSSDLRRTPVLLTGAGTSAYAASAVAAAWPGARAIPTTDLLLMAKDELDQSVPGFTSGGLLISFARSGDSPESVAVVERIKKVSPLIEHLAIVCNAEGKLARMPGISVLCLNPATNDRSLAMTSSFSNLAICGLSLRHEHELSARLPVICDRVSRNLASMNDLARLIADSDTDRVVALSSTMHALTQEASLKVIELTAGRVLAISESFLGVRHGPQSFIRENTLIICFISSDKHKQSYERDVIETLRSQSLGKIILVIGDPAGWQYDWFVQASSFDLPDYLRTPFEIPFMQLLAYQLAVHFTVDPDNPSPSGAVTRVVKPFKIHHEVASN